MCVYSNDSNDLLNEMEAVYKVYLNQTSSLFVSEAFLLKINIVACFSVVSVV